MPLQQASSWREELPTGGSAEAGAVSQGAAAQPDPTGRASNASASALGMGELPKGAADEGGGRRCGRACNNFVSDNGTRIGFRDGCLSMSRCEEGRGGVKWCSLMHRCRRMDR